MVRSRAGAGAVFDCLSTAGLRGAFAVVPVCPGSSMSAPPAVEVFVSTKKSQAVRGAIQVGKLARCGIRDAGYGIGDHRAMSHCLSRTPASCVILLKSEQTLRTLTLPS